MNAYQSAIRKCPNSADAAAEYLRFVKSETETYPNTEKSYPWKETGRTLAQSVKEASELPSNTTQFEFEMDGNTPVKFV